MAARSKGTGFWEYCTAKGCTLGKDGGPKRLMAPKTPTGAALLCAEHSKAAGLKRLAVPMGDTRAERASMTEAQVKAAQAAGDWKMDYTHGGRYNRVAVKAASPKAKASTPKVAAEATPKAKRSRPKAKTA